MTTPSPLPLQPSLAPTTTTQQDLTTAGQRKVNLIWEYTQAIIAIEVVSSSIILAVSLAFKGKSNDFPILLASLLMLVVGFYFSRTNHQAIGGVGPKPEPQKYEGR